VRARVNAYFAKMYAHPLYIPPFSVAFSLFRPLVNAGVSALGQRKKRRGGGGKEGKKKSEMHSLPYPEKNVSATNDKAGIGGIG